MSKIEGRIEGVITVGKKYRWIAISAYALILYAVLLRLDLAVLTCYWKEDRNEYLIIFLLETFKGESEDFTHLIPCVPVTSSGNDNGLKDRARDEGWSNHI